MNEFFKKHFQAVKNRKMETVLEGYSHDLSAIVYLGGKTQTLKYESFVALMKNVLNPERTNRDIEVQMCRSTEEFGVMAATCQGDLPYMVYTIMVENGVIVRATLYIFRPSENFLPESVNDVLPEGKAAKKMFYKHTRAMFSVSADVISKDYDEDCVVITNFAPDVCDGKAQMYAFCDKLMKAVWKLVKEIKVYGFPKITWRVGHANDGFLLFVCEAPAMHMVMTETYWVKNGKIKFESSVCGGKMQQACRRLIK